MLDKIERIEILPFSEKLRYFQKKAPWDGLTLPNTTVVLRSSVNLIDGNVTRMPELPGKPCFGNPIAWIAHGVLEARQTKKGFVPTRCGRCKAREGCGTVAEARLAISNEVAAAAQAFRAAGGAKAFHDNKRNEPGYALGKLEQAIIAVGPFWSVNDDYALRWVRSEKARMLADATRRQREKRARDARSELRHRLIPVELMDQLEHEKVFRIARFNMFAKSSGAPMTVTVDRDGSSALFTAEVWRAKTILAIRNKKKEPTAYGITKLMLEEGNDFGLGEGSLRDRVNRALRRIETLESRVIPELGVPAWPIFSPTDTLDWFAKDPLRNLR